MPTCVHCSSAFDITDADLAFLEKVSPVFAGKKMHLPAPTHCPDCRQQRRVAQANQMNLSKRTCDATGESIVSPYHSDAPYTVYKQKYWWSDQWDPLDYGREFDFNRPFFEQYNELLLAVPRHNINTQYELDENADYTNYATNNKDCYLIFDSDYNRDCYYCYSMNRCESCMDCFRIRKGELCYECIDCVECYNCKYVQDSTNCSDSLFLKNCIGCRRCIMCSNMNNKEYCVKNKQVSREEYEKIRSSLESFVAIQDAIKRFDAFKLQYPQKYIHGVHNEGVVGDYLTNSKQAFHCFDSSEMWDCRYCYQIWEPVKDSVDLQEIGDAELCYDSAYGGLQTRNLLFCSHCFNNMSLIYCTYCMHCSDLFGCVSMRRKKHCIFNKQYSKEEYEKLAKKIIEHMQRTGEWGEYFPIALSCFPYNETQAQDYFPLTKKEAQKQGYKWRDQKDEVTGVEKIIPSSKLPDSIDDIPDDILNWALKCTETARPYRIITKELQLYRQMHLPIPRMHPNVRHKHRMSLRNPRMLWNRTCAKCMKAIQTTYAPERPEKVFCEKCYLDSLH